MNRLLLFHSLVVRDERLKASGLNQVYPRH
jgi:hypothetical protein